MIRHFKVDIREPYMGNTIVVGIKVDIDFERKTLVKLSVATSTDTIAQEVRVLTFNEFAELFND